MEISILIPEYLRQLHALGRSPCTIRTTKYGLRDFTRFLKTEDLHQAEDLTADVLSEYRQDLSFRITAKGGLLSIRSQVRHLCVVKGFTRFLRDRDYLVHDPAASLKLPKEPKRLPSVILSRSEIKILMQTPDMRTNQGFRNRIALEILYDTAIRRAELANVRISDPDLKSGYLRITGKGDKERVVPLSPGVCDLVNAYILSVRPSYIKGDDPGWLILNRNGQKMNVAGIWAIVKRCAALSGLKKNITVHTFRHTCATHMLKNGAPIRHIQEMLGRILRIHPDLHQGHHQRPQKNPRTVPSGGTPESFH